MYVTALRAHGFRNLDGDYPICDPLSVVVGENNAGKSNLVDALRIVLEPEAGPGTRSRVWPEDDGRGNVLADRLELEVQLGSLSEAEQARMVTCLAPSLGPGAHDCGCRHGLILTVGLSPNGSAVTRPTRMSSATRGRGSDTPISNP